MADNSEINEINEINEIIILPKLINYLQKIERRVVLRVPIYMGVARLVAPTDFLVVVSRLFG